MKRLWRNWARALGEKIGSTNAEADKVAFFRTIIVLQAIIANAFIVINILKRWNQ
jgi:hypothetical protein